MFQSDTQNPMALLAEINERISNIQQDKKDLKQGIRDQKHEITRLNMLGGE